MLRDAGIIAGLMLYAGLVWAVARFCGLGSRGERTRRAAEVRRRSSDNARLAAAALCRSRRIVASRDDHE